MRIYFYIFLFLVWSFLIGGSYILLYDLKFFIDVAKTKNIIINNPLEYFMENKDSDNMSWSLIDFHPNCKAHEIMANYIVEKIL